MNDFNDEMLFAIDSTMSESRRAQLWNAIEALARITGEKLHNRDSSKDDSSKSFNVWHFSYYARYGQSVSVLLSRGGRCLKHCKQGHEVPKDYHPLHIQSTDGSKVNHAQFFIRASTDIQEYESEHHTLTEAVGYTFQDIIEKVLDLFFQLTLINFLLSSGAPEIQSCSRT